MTHFFLYTPSTHINKQGTYLTKGLLMEWVDYFAACAHHRVKRAYNQNNFNSCVRSSRLSFSSLFMRATQSNRTVLGNASHSESSKVILIFTPVNFDHLLHHGFRRQQERSQTCRRMDRTRRKLPKHPGNVFCRFSMSSISRNGLTRQ